MRGPNRGSAAEKILDLLDMDGQEWSTTNLADRLGLSYSTCNRALHRLRHKEMVRRRIEHGEGLHRWAMWKAA